MTVEDVLAVHEENPIEGARDAPLAVDIIRQERDAR